MRFPEYPIRKLEKQGNLEQEANVPIIDIIRHGHTDYREVRQKQAERLGQSYEHEHGNLEFNPESKDFKLSEEHLDINADGIRQIQEAAEELDKLVDKKKETILIVSSPMWRAHSSALVLEKALREKGVNILNTEGELKLFEQMGEQDALLQRRIHRIREAKEKGKELTHKIGDTEREEALNFHRFIRHMNNIYQWLGPETKAKLEGRRLRVICLAHQENAMNFLAETFRGENEDVYLYGNGQILEFIPKSPMKAGERTQTQVTVYPTPGHEKEEVVVERGFEPGIETQGTEGPFALDGWKYNQDSLDAFVDRVSAGDADLQDDLRSAFQKGGGKAFGLKVCELIAEKTAEHRNRIEVPKWRVVKNARTLVPKRHEKEVLRGSYPNEDWIDPRTGVGESFNLANWRGSGRYRFEQAKKKGELPNHPFILQEATNGVGVVVDIGYSSLYGNPVIRMAYGNQRVVTGARLDRAIPSYTSATEDTEAGFGVWDAATGKPILPTQNLYYPSLYESGKKFDFPIEGLFEAIRNTGIDFGVQAELVIDPQRGRWHLVQIRPTPDRLLRRISLPTSTEKQSAESGKLFMESAVTNAAFDFTAKAEFFGREGLLKNDEEGDKSANTVRSGAGIIGFHDEPFDASKRYVRLDSHSAGKIYFGAYLRGAEVQITREAIRPNSLHGSMGHTADPEKLDLVDQRCGMVSIPRHEMDNLADIAREAKQPLIVRVVSDGLIARIYLQRNDIP